MDVARDISFHERRSTLETMVHSSGLHALSLSADTTHDQPASVSQMGHAPSQPALMTWSSILSRPETSIDALSLAKDHPPRRWKLLITVIDCSKSSRLHNPPRSIHMLKARLSAAVGVENSALEGAASAETIVTGINGPQRKPLEHDDDLQEFWDHVRSERSDKSSTITNHLQSPMLKAYPSNPLTPTQAVVAALGVVNEEPGSMEEESVEECVGPTLEEVEARCRAAEDQVAQCQEEIAELQFRLSTTEEELEQTRQACATLEEQNLDYLRRFEEQLDQRREEILRQTEEKFKATMMTQAQQIADAESHRRRLEGELRLNQEKVKQLESSNREQRRVAAQALASVEDSRTQKEEHLRQIAAKSARVKQLEYIAQSWRRKVDEMSRCRLKEFSESEACSTFRILNVSSKLTEFPKGRLVQSPEFEVPNLGRVQFEFCPTGDMKSRDGWCSLRLRVPDRSHVRWIARIGTKDYGPRTDYYDQSHWWNRYGIVWLNLCPVEEVRAQILSESDSLLCGIAVLEILPLPSDAASKPMTVTTDEQATFDEEQSRAGSVVVPALTSQLDAHKTLGRPFSAPNARARGTDSAQSGGASRGSLGLNQGQHPRPKVPLLSYGQARSESRPRGVLSASFPAPKQPALPAAVAPARRPGRPCSVPALRISRNAKSS